IPARPACTVKAATRDEAIRPAREAIAQTVSCSEIVQIDIPQQPRATAQPPGVPWEWFGEAKADPTWDALFDDIEQRREATRDVEWRACISGTRISYAPLGRAMQHCLS